MRRFKGSLVHGGLFQDSHRALAINREQIFIPQIYRATVRVNAEPRPPPSPLAASCHKSRPSVLRCAFSRRARLGQAKQQFRDVSSLFAEPSWSTPLGQIHLLLLLLLLVVVVVVVPFEGGERNGLTVAMSTDKWSTRKKEENASMPQSQG